jgi:uncharacterized damage-inducible protein DinB
MHLDKPLLIRELADSLRYLKTATGALTEDDAGFAPQSGMFTTAQQVAHIGQTNDWFLEAVTRPEGFDMDFEKHAQIIAGVTSLAEAHAWVARSFDALAAWLRDSSEEELMAPLPEGPIMGGEAKWRIVLAIIDHTAHHRGALSVYTRVLGKTPPMPYIEGEATA